MQEKQKKNCAAEVEKAVEMSQLSMETLAESKKRKSQRNDGEKSKRRMSSTSTETNAYFQKKWKLMLNLKEELRLRQLEADERRQQQNNMTSQHEDLTKALTDSIAAQQRQQEQMMHQMQIQNTALLLLIQCITKKD